MPTMALLASPLNTEKANFCGVLPMGYSIDTRQRALEPTPTSLAAL